jgi:hypothetical protein
MRRPPLPIIIMAERLRLDLSLYPRLLDCLLGGRLMGLLALHRPALGDEPALGLPRRHEKDLDPTVLDPERESRDLAELFFWALGHSERVGISWRCC